MELQTIITEKDGMYFFSVTSDGTTGQGWDRRITSYNNRYVSNLLKFLEPTNGVTSNLVLVKGDFFKKFSKEGWIPNGKMQKFALKNGLKAPSAEVTGLVLEMLANTGFHKKMNIIVVSIMHEPINDLDGNPFSFCILSKNNDLYLEIQNAGPDYSHSDWSWYVFEKA